MYYLGTKRLPLDRPFSDRDGYQYPPDWLRHSTAQQREAIGITEQQNPNLKKAVVEKLVAEVDEAARTEEAKSEKASASKSGSEADDERANSEPDDESEVPYSEQSSSEADDEQVLSGAALRYGQQFELTTPMLVMPFSVFKAQGRIMKSIKAWRDEALAAGSLVEHEEGSGQIVIFISHTWWDRSFTDATNDPNNPYDKGAPDWQKGKKKKNLKWRVICAGVQRLLEQEGLKEEEVSLWVDWQSIYQDDEAEKLKGVKSLIRYATLCQYMLVPTEEAELYYPARSYPEDIPAYGSRGWW